MDFNNCKWTQSLQKEFDYLPNTYGVYLITCRTADKRVVIYTGKSKDLKRRSKEHWSEEEENKMLRNIIKKFPGSISFWWTEIDGRSYEGIEHFLRNHYKPQTQNRAPDVDSQPINLPENVESGVLPLEWFE